MGLIATVRTLSVGDVGRLAAAAALLALVRVVVIVAPFARLRTALLSVATRTGPLVPGDPTPESVARAVAVADARVPGERKCLHRSLTAETVLRLYGHDVAHRIGVDPSDESGFAAHSWLERDGDVLIGDLPDLDRYEPLGDLDDVEPATVGGGGENA